MLTALVSTTAFILVPVTMMITLFLYTEAAGLGFDLSWISTSEAGEEAYADNEFVLTISKSM